MNVSRDNQADWAMTLLRVLFYPEQLPGFSRYNTYIGCSIASTIAYNGLTTALTLLQFQTALHIIHHHGRGDLTHCGMTLDFIDS